MKKIKTQKGITLVALIITIIVLLILAVVAINAVQGDGIIAHAKNAQTKYQSGTEKENTTLASYELVLAQETGKAWKQTGTTVSKGETKLEVGQTVTNFTAGGYTWKVLGEENGALLLMINQNLNLDDDSTTSDTLTLRGSDGWDSTTNTFKVQEDKLDAECVKEILTDNSLTLEGIGATKVRSIRVEDINRIVGYVPTAGATYTYNSTNNNGLCYSDGRSVWENGVNEITLTNTYYTYEGTYNNILEENSAAHIMLFKDSDNTYARYWLASSWIQAYSPIFFCGLHIVSSSESMTKGKVTFCTMDSYSGYDCGVRAVVSLASDFQPTV